MSLVMELRFGSGIISYHILHLNIIIPHPFPKRCYHIVDRNRLDSNTLKEESTEKTMRDESYGHISD